MLLKKKNGIQAACREARYDILKKNMNNNEVLITAQHLNDQCETLLLALKRGSGPCGLSAMSMISYLGKFILLRPMLNISLNELKNWANKYYLQWIEDDSNKNIKYDRNFLRINIIPLLINRWPYFLKTVARTSNICRDQEKLIDELLEEDLNQLIQVNNSILFTPMLNMSDNKRNAILRRWLNKYNINMPTKNKLLQIWYEVVLSSSNAQPCFKIGNYEIRRYKKFIFCINQRHSLNNYIVSWININKLLKLPYNLGFLKSNINQGAIRFPYLNEKVTIRFTASGYHNFVGKKGKCKIKKIWQHYNIPPWNRNNIPLIYYNEILISSPGFFITYEGYSGNIDGWHIDWIK